MNTQMLFTGWHFMRWLRLGLGIMLAIQAIQLHDMVSGFVAAFFLYQAGTNTGCCGVNDCAIPPANINQDKIEEVEFEEVKTK